VKRFVLALPLVWTVGCHQEMPVGQSVAASNPLDDELGYESHQGTQLLGFNDQNVSYFMLEPGLGAGSVDATGELRSERGLSVEGARLEAVRFDGSRVEMQLSRVVPPDAGSPLWRYYLEERDPQTGALRPACAEPTTLYPQAPAGPLAVALPGSWLANGTYARDPRTFAFSCRSGVVAKCTSWGYPAGGDLGGPTLGGNWRAVEGPDLLQACTRMARADYCSNGISRTVDGTAIHVYDIFGGPLRPERSVPGFAFEAAWLGEAWKTADGGPRQEPALCLSKLRWSTLPLGGDCPLTLPDPRVKGDARFCEDYDQRDLEKMGAVFFDDSPVIDAGLYSWTSARGDEWLTTAHQLPSPPPNPPEPFAGELATPPGVELPALTPRLEGALFRVEVHAPAGTTLLRSWFCPDRAEAPKAGGDYVTSTTTPADPACVELAREGFLYAPDVSYPAGTRNRVPLRRWQRGVPDRNLAGRLVRRSLTSTEEPATLRARGWRPVALEGYLPR
jgi:hypothetical protein